MSPGYLVSAFAGLALWSIAALLSGGREPVDVPEFWSLYWPLSIAMAFGIGLLFPVRSWLCGLILTGMMMPVMLWNGSGASLLPIAAVFLAVLSIPGCLAGWMGGALRRRRARSGH